MALNKEGRGNGINLSALSRFPGSFFPRGKKGVFFTFVAVVFLALLIFSSSIRGHFNLRQISFATETRIGTMNMFISDVEEDIERGTYIAGFRSLVAMADEIVTNGEYIDDADMVFNELFFNGTINSTNSSLLVNNSFTDWMSKIKAEAGKIDLTINFSDLGAEIYQESPWEVCVEIHTEIFITDREKTSSWRKNRTIKSYIELNGFEDPLYPMGTNGLVENRIEETIHTNFTIGTDVDNLLNHTYDGYYIAFSGAPSYLMRLEGNLSSSMYGIESLVDIDELISKGVDVESKSIVDYIYFSGDDPVDYEVDGTPSWFKLDNETDSSGNLTHLDVYQVNELI